MKTKHWIIILGLIMSAAACAVYLGVRGYDGHMAGIYVDGELLQVIDMSRAPERKEITVTGKNGENTVLVENGSIRVISATCPDKICVKHGALKDGEPIVCLPNRLIIRWISGEKIKFDADAVG